MIKDFILILLLLMAFTSCQQSLIKKEMKTTEVDSSLYFEQVKIADPFLEKLKENSNQSFSLNKTFIPLPPPEPEKLTYKIIEGFRVQIYAGVDQENAIVNKSIAKSAVKDTIYEIIEKGLIKLQVGDYPYYPQADSIKRIFRQTHFPGAWIVKTNIFIPNIDSQADTMLQSQMNPVPSGKYKIQVLATADEGRAKSILDELKTQFNERAFYELSGNMFKVYVGNFEKEEEARKALKKIREGKFPDAWLVY